VLVKDHTELVLMGIVYTVQKLQHTVSRVQMYFRQVLVGPIHIHLIPKVQHREKKARLLQYIDLFSKICSRDGLREGLLHKLRGWGTILRTSLYADDVAVFMAPIK
jgi:hypothetical protein